MSNHWKSIVVGTSSDGKMSILKGIDVPSEEQRSYVNGLVADGKLPKGYECVELVSRGGGVVKTARPNKAATPEELVTASVRSLSTEAILAELHKPTKKQTENKALAEEALIKQRLAGKAPLSNGAPVTAKAADPPAGGSEEPPAGGSEEPPAGGSEDPPAGGSEEPPVMGG